jgi:hypothetical protein
MVRLILKSQVSSLNRQVQTLHHKLVDLLEGLVGLAVEEIVACARQRDEFVRHTALPAHPAEVDRFTVRHNRILLPMDNEKALKQRTWVMRSVELAMNAETAETAAAIPHLYKNRRIRPLNEQSDDQP